jgi:thiol-disulfide isomerase/thioredoxin/outer membrane protein assembly factor BamD (BamD/ComL family)
MKRSIVFVLVVLACKSGVLAAVNVGDKPNLQFKSVQGEKVDLAALKGKIVVVDFWATWCGPCMAEAPHMVQINQKYKDKGLQLIGISLDQNGYDALNGAKTHGLNWPQACAGGGWSSEYAKIWGVDSIPRTFIIGPDGVVLWTGHPAEIDAPLEDAFKSHPPQFVDSKTLADADTTLDQVGLAIQSGSTEKAIQLLAAMPPDAQKDPTVADRMHGAQAKLQDAGAKMLADAQSLADAKQYDQAIASLQDISRAFLGSPISDKAKGKLNDLMKDPACKAAIDKSHRQASAASALAEAQELQAQKKDIEAYQRFKSIVSTYADTPAADPAAKAIAAYESDPGFAQRAKDAAAADRSKALLGLADAYHKSGRDDLAKAKLQTIIDSFPDSSYAQKAQKALDAMSQGN